MKNFRFKQSLFPLPFRAGEGEDGNKNTHEHDGDYSENVYYSKRHTDPSFLANSRERYQSDSVAPTPNGTISQYGLSMPIAKNGERTIIPKNTCPALSQIFESRASWDRVNTGSLGRGKIMPDGFITHNTSTRAYISSMMCVVILYFLMISSVFAQSDVFEKLVALNPGRDVPSWVIAQGIAVPNTDLTDPGKHLYSFPSEDPVSPYLVSMRDGKIIGIQLPIPESERRRYQELFFAERYNRVLIGQDSRETVYFLPTTNAMIVLDTVTGDVLRLEKKKAAAAPSAPETPAPTKRVAYAVIALSLAAIAVLLAALAIEVFRWKPKEDDHQLAPAT